MHNTPTSISINTPLKSFHYNTLMKKGILSFILFIVAGCLIGVGMVTIIGAPLRYIVLCEAKPYERGAGQAIVNMLSSAGQLIGGALIGGVIASFSDILGYKISLILAAIVAFIAFLFTLKLKGRNEQIETMKSNQ